jgi:acetoin utilization deacetylase AcuC-like enzyme
MRLTTACFERLTALVAGVAEECSEGRLVAVTEGGYHLTGLGDGLRGVVRAMAGESRTEDLPIPDGPTPRGEETVAAVAPHLAPYWTI